MSFFCIQVAEVSNPMLLSSNITFPDEIDSSKPRSLKRTEVSKIRNR